jgi:hypothetical protein
MMAWPRFGKRRSKKPVLCEAHVSGSQRNDGPERVHINFDSDDDRRLTIDMSVDEARVLGRGLMTMWKKEGEQ